MTEHRPWPEAGRHGTELADIRRELADLADKQKAGGGLTEEQRRRYDELIRRETKLLGDK